MPLGNTGAGKSTLLTQLGGNFESGAKFRKGLTKHVSGQRVVVNHKIVCLIDVPGVFGASDTETKHNAKELNTILSLGQSFRIYFVLRASNRGPGGPEMVMMSKISECVRKADGSRMSFGVIVNQISSDKVGAMYKELAKDNFQSTFEGLGIPGFTFDIKIDSVIMLPFDALGWDANRLRVVLTEEIHKHPASAIKLEK